jgi:hypothetical protein
MKSERFWLKKNVLEYFVFPQLPSFCGIAACCGALGSILGTQITEQMLHARYAVGLYTKLQAPVSCSPDNFAGLTRSGPGFSNWDVIRLCNAVLLDEGREPAAVVLCGEDFVRESGDLTQLQQLLEWLRNDYCQAIVHTVDHYTLVAGAFRHPLSAEIYLLLADSATRSGPLRSLRLADLKALANRDQRYGLVLVTDRTIPQSLFRNWTSAMLSPEVTDRQRFARIDGT